MFIKSLKAKSINKRKFNLIYYIYVISEFILLDFSKSLNNKRFRLSFIKLNNLKGFEKILKTLKTL